MSSFERGTSTGGPGAASPRDGDPTPVHSRQLQVLTDLQHGHARVRVTGEIDLDSAPLLWSALAQVLHGRVERLEVDLAGVQFCDCTALNVLLRTRLRAQDSGVAMTLARASTSVQRLLDLTETRMSFTLTEPDSSPRANR